MPASPDTQCPFRTRCRQKVPDTLHFVFSLLYRTPSAPPAYEICRLLPDLTCSSSVAAPLDESRVAVTDIPQGGGTVKNPTGFGIDILGSRAGMAAVLHDRDTVQAHVDDTLSAGSRPLLRSCSAIHRGTQPADRRLASLSRA
jgi:hypothetical protein